MPVSFVRNDITKLEVDAIVNAANTGLRQGGGVCGAIFAAAGEDDMRAACEAIGHVDTGQSVATPGFALPARYVIHTAGPRWFGGFMHEPEQLASSYTTALTLARELDCESIAFPLISSGIYGYPPKKALEVALKAIRAYLEDDPDMEVILCLFDRKALGVAKGILGEVESYIDDAYVDESPYRRRSYLEESEAVSEMADYACFPMEDAVYNAPVSKSAKSASRFFGNAAPAAAAPSMAPQATAPSLENLLAHMDASFSETLLAMIDARGLTDSQVYSRANLSRQYFSKLRSGSINPSKRVICALAVALELTLDETRLLLERAGHALTHANKFDIVVEWFILQGRYDIFEINETLFALDQPLLGAS